MQKTVKLSFYLLKMFLYTQERVCRILYHGAWGGMSDNLPVMNYQCKDRWLGQHVALLLNLQSKAAEL